MFQDFTRMLRKCFSKNNFLQLILIKLICMFFSGVPLILTDMIINPMMLKGFEVLFRFSRQSYSWIYVLHIQQY